MMKNGLGPVGFQKRGNRVKNVDGGGTELVSCFGSSGVQ